MMNFYSMADGDTDKASAITLALLVVPAET